MRSRIHSVNSEGKEIGSKIGRTVLTADRKIIPELKMNLKSGISYSPDNFSPISYNNQPASDGITKIQLRAKTIETINALQSNGELQKILISGQISLIIPQNLPKSLSGLLTVSNFNSFAAVKCNEKFISPYTNADNSSGEYMFDTDSFIGLENTEVSLIKYQLKADISNVEYLPLICKPVWKMNELECQLLLIYQYNRKFPQFKPSNINIHVVLDGGITSVEAVPECNIAGSNGISWGLCGNDGLNEIKKLKAKIQTASKASPHPVMMEFTARNILLSDADFQISFLGDKNVYFDVSVEKEVVSGHYGAVGSLL